jgi:hypothetical protein
LKKPDVRVVPVAPTTTENGSDAVEGGVVRHGK